MTQKFGIYVVLWRYSDGSASGAVCFARTKEDADAVLALLQDQNSLREYSVQFIQPMTFEGGYE